MKKESRTLWIDALKIVAMVLVILLHVMGNTINTFGLNEYHKTVYDALIALANVCIPIFVMVSGYLLLNPKKEMGIKRMFKKYALKILLILGTFGTFFIVLEEYFNTRTVDLEMFKNTLVRLITGNVWAHMWYLYMLLGLYLITPLLKILTNNITKEKFKYLLFILYFLTILIPDIKFAFGIEINLYMFQMPYLFYYLLGCYLSMYEITEKQKIIFYILGLFSIVLVLINYSDGYNYINVSYGTTYLVILAMSLFLLFKNAKINSRFSKIITSIGECSLGIYILHQFYINLIFKILKIDIILDLPYLGLIGYSFVIFIVTYVSVYILKKIKYVDKLL